MQKENKNFGKIPKNQVSSQINIVRFVRIKKFSQKKKKKRLTVNEKKAFFGKLPTIKTRINKIFC